MRALVLRGFCKGIGDYAVVDEIVDIPKPLFLIMKSQGAVSDAPPEPEESPAKPVAEAAPKSKGAAAR